MPLLAHVRESAAVADHNVEVSIREQGQVGDAPRDEGIDSLQQSRFADLLLGELKLTLREIESRHDRP